MTGELETFFPTYAKTPLAKPFVLWAFQQTIAKEFLPNRTGFWHANWLVRDFPPEPATFLGTLVHTMTGLANVPDELRCAISRHLGSDAAKAMLPVSGRGRDAVYSALIKHIAMDGTLPALTRVLGRPERSRRDWKGLLKAWALTQWLSQDMECEDTGRLFQMLAILRESDLRAIDGAASQKKQRVNEWSRLSSWWAEHGGALGDRDVSREAQRAVSRFLWNKLSERVDWPPRGYFLEPAPRDSLLHDISRVTWDDLMLADRGGACRRTSWQTGGLTRLRTIVEAKDRSGSFLSPQTQDDCGVEWGVFSRSCPARVAGAKARLPHVLGELGFGRTMPWGCRADSACTFEVRSLVQSYMGWCSEDLRDRASSYVWKSFRPEREYQSATDLRAKEKLGCPGNPELLLSSKGHHEFLKLPTPAAYTYQTTFAFVLRTMLRNVEYAEYRKEAEERRPIRRRRNEEYDRIEEEKRGIGDERADQQLADIPGRLQFLNMVFGTNIWNDSSRERDIALSLREGRLDETQRAGTAEDSEARQKQRAHFVRNPDDIYSNWILSQAVRERSADWWTCFFRRIGLVLEKSDVQRHAAYTRLHEHFAIRVLFDTQEGMTHALEALEAISDRAVAPKRPNQVNANFDHAKKELRKKGNLAPEFHAVFEALFPRRNQRDSWTRFFADVHGALADKPQERSHMEIFLSRFFLVQKLEAKYGLFVQRQETGPDVPKHTRPGHHWDSLRCAAAVLQERLSSDSWDRLLVLTFGWRWEE
jgi:hypothetical protein